MAPARSSTRRAHLDQNIQIHHQPPDISDLAVDDELFLDPMLGTPLAIYVEKDVHDRENLVNLITKHGGTISPGYSGVPYIIVDPLLSSGQNLYRQYAGKKGKIVLSYRWIHECIKAEELQTFHQNWANCKVTGNEVPPPAEIPPTASTSTAASQPHPRRSSRQGQNDMQVDQAPRQIAPPQSLHPQALHTGPVMPHVETLVHPHNTFPYPMYHHPAIHPAPRGMHSTPAPPQTWQSTTGIAPQQTHIVPAQEPQMLHRPAYRDETWVAYGEHTPHAGDTIAPTATTFDYNRYNDDQRTWGPYYEATYDQPYDQAATQQYIEEPNPSSNAGAGPSTLSPVDPSDKGNRGRKRTRMQSTPAAPASTLVLNRNPLERSPTPPTRVIKSTYGGNLFTSDDVEYLKKYIDYCQSQGLVLSLREICERIAVKAPHHTFYSWRRYCNKHQIRLGGYKMRSESPSHDGDQDMEDEEPAHRTIPNMGTIAAAQHRARADAGTRTRSPTPPRALFRSTTGKGVAFTEEDVTFLVRFLEYRKSQGRLDMVLFWKDVAAKAPHHSRASWMKFWRRHKHELNRTDGDEPLPQPPDKKMRYSREDDVLLAKYFCNKPEGTSDKIFQAFGRMHSHHPWKGWQEHHRIHKAKIDHFIQQLANGENIDGPDSVAG